MRDTAEPRRCAVLGDPIAHSLSPALHRAGYAAVGLDWRYDAVRVAEGELTEHVRGLGSEWRGLSLTMPLKRRALGLAAEVTERARLTGAANTLVLEDGVVAVADNTDLPGAVAAVRERYDGAVTAGTVLGGGATAASTGLALCELGATSVRLLVRDPERAGPTLAAIAAHPAAPQVEAVPLTGGDVAGEIAGEIAGEVVVSTIPVAAQDADLVARCAAVPVVFEVVYDPWPTPLAASVGPDRTLVTGLDLLAHQAALQFELFTGRPVPVETLRAAGEHELAARRAVG